MKFRWLRYNSYLLLLVAAGLTGCETTQPGGSAKAAQGVATLHVHLETHRDPLGLSRQITIGPVGSENPQTFFITPPMITEEALVAARLWEGTGEQFAIHLQFDRAGQRSLETLSMSYRGKRLALMSQFPEARWIGTVRMDRRIADGALLFRPEITREEAVKLVRLLNGTVAKLKKYKD
ncbi:MAG: hypothetical protein RL514_4706 [Verrucomicrobiota bacterium]|jgi:hypothetical protein